MVKWIIDADPWDQLIHLCFWPHKRGSYVGHHTCDPLLIGKQSYGFIPYKTCNFVAPKTRYVTIHTYPQPSIDLLLT